MAQRFLFVGGKGGVGKTTCAAALALAASAVGRRVLLVSSDPAHSLADALGMPLGAAARVVPGTGGRLLAAQIDAERALARWLGRRQPALRLLARRVSVLDEQDVARLSALPLPGVDELVGLLELRRLGQSARATEVVVDTAPTGHTLRLLAAPALLRSLSGALEDLLSEEREVRARLGANREDAADLLVAEIASQAEAQAELLQDPERCECVWVTLPEELSWSETRDGLAALRAAGIMVRELVVNRVAPAGSGLGARLQPRSRRAQTERRLIARIAVALPELPLRLLPELSREPRGVPALRALGGLLAPPARRGRRAATGAEGASPAATPAPRRRAPARRGRQVVHRLAPASLRLLLFAGKGGVGKTSCAAAAALAIAAGDERVGELSSRRLLLVSVDPAHSLGDVLELALGDRARRVGPYSERLRARELDPAASWRRWRQRLAAAAARESSPAGALDDLLQLTPPGVDELLAVLEISARLRRARPGRARPRAAPELVVVDCAPTGHALRLLRMPEVALGWTRALLEILLKYRRVAALGPLACVLLRLTRALRELAELLRDPAAAAVCVVTRGGELPGRETERLTTELRRRGIRVAALLGVGTPPAGDVAAAVARGSAGQACAMIFCPWRWPPPRGPRELERWGAAWEETIWSGAGP